MRKTLIILFSIACAMLSSAQTTVECNFSEVINKGFIGNGAQWNPYQLQYADKHLDITEADWQKMYHRLDFMRPQLMRVVHNTANLVIDGKLRPENNIDQIDHILSYCQSRGVNVIFGDWGWGLADAKVPVFDKKKVELAADYLAFLVNKKGYTCIKYYNMINEPNGDWSTTAGNYDLWRDITLCFYKRMKKNKLLDKVCLIGPDIAIWTTEDLPWIEKSAKDVDFGLYDIHTYPSKITINNNDYTEIIKAYKNAIPDGKQIVMGEIGLKFVEPADSLYQQEMLRRAAVKPFACYDDSQMFVYDYMYGIDMADAVMQVANAGLSGAVAWMVDDAMHSANGRDDKLKIWGFWNILGEEYFCAEDEAVRPWFYAWSLLTRYMPKECDICASKVSGNPSVKAVAVKHKGKTMMAILNVSKNPQFVSLRANTKLAVCKEFIYAEGKLKKLDEATLVPNNTFQELDFYKGKELEMPGESLFVFTDFDY